jgi:nitrite reductase/ring-hydroxylating ferredoxin subunit
MNAGPKKARMLARVDEIPDCGVIIVDAGGESGEHSLILARYGETVHAYRNRCSHAGYPLQRADGRVLVQERRFLVCAAHGASYAIDTGACAGGPCGGLALSRVAIEVSEGEVRLALSPR